MLDNISKVITFKRENNLEYPKIKIAAVLNSESLNTLEEFMEKLGDNNMCDSLMISPMNLPKAYADKIGIYPVATNDTNGNKDELSEIRTIFNNVKAKGQKLDIDIIFSGKLSNLAYGEIN